MYMTYKKANGEAHKRLSVWPSLVHVWNTALWQFQWKLGLTIWGSMPPRGFSEHCLYSYMSGKDQKVTLKSK